MAGSPVLADYPGEALATPLPAMERIGNLAHPDLYKARCCKTCRKGKACGDSCISKSKSCRKGPGCACNG